MSPISHKYLSHNGHILEIYTEGHNYLKIKVNSLDLSDRKWKQTADFSWSSKVKVELLSVAEIVEESTSLRIPVALIGFNNDKRVRNTGVVCYLVYINIESGRCVALRKFSLDTKMTIHQSILDLALQVHILDGPTILFQNQSDVFLYSGTDSLTLKQYCFPLLPQCKPCQLSFCQTIYYCHKNICRTNIIFLGISYDKSCKPCQRSGSQAFIVLKFQDGEFKKLDPNIIIPKEFHDQLNFICVNFLKLEEDQSFKSSEAYVCTKAGFILSLKDGYLTKCVSFNESLTTQMFLNNEEKAVLHLIDSEDKKYIIVEKEQTCIFLDQELEIQKQYEDVHHLIYGDFIGNGTVQCLLLKSTPISDSHWILDDLNQLCINSEEQELSAATEDAGSTHTATKALQSRLQQEQLVLQEEEQSLCKKKEFIEEIVDRQLLTAAGLDTTYPREKIDLLTLIGEETEELSTVQPGGSRSETPIVVCGQWQRTYDYKWCLGVEFQWKSEKDAEIWLTLVPAKDFNIQLCLESRPIKCKSEVQGSQSRQKKKRTEILPNVSNDSHTSSDRLEPRLYTVICVTDIPKFLKKSILIYLNIKWRYLQSDINIDDCELDIDKDDVISFTDCTVFTQQCGKISLESQAVILGKHEISFMDCGAQDVFMDHFMEDFNELQRSKLAWKHVQTSTDLVVKSSAGVLAQLDKLLLDRCSFVYNNHFQCYITHVTVLCKVQVELPPSSQDDCRQMRIYTRSDKDLLLLLHHLYECLPDSIVILPNNNNRKQLQKILTRMHQETSFFSQGVRKLLEDHDSKMSADTERKVLREESHKNKDIKKIRERFKRKDEEFLEKDRKLIETSDIEEFLAKMTLLQKKTDTSLAIENSSQ